MNKAYIALITAAGQAGEDYEKYKNDSYFSYIYANKRAILSETAEALKVSGDIRATLERLRADFAEYSGHVEEEAVHPTFDWAGEHIWEIIYTGRVDGAKQAIAILEEYLKLDS